MNEPVDVLVEYVEVGNVDVIVLAVAYDQSHHRLVYLHTNRRH